MRSHLARGHRGVGQDAVLFLEAFRLHLSSCDYAIADGLCFFSAGRAGELFEVNERNFDVKINAI